MKSSYLFLKAQHRHGKGRIDEAISGYKEALALNPGSAGVRLHLGLALARKGDDRKAEHEIRKAVELEPGNPVMPLFLGRILSEQGRWEEALQSVDRSLGIDRDNRLCLSLKGLLLLPLGRQEEGQALLGHYFSGGPDWLEALLLFYCERLCKEEGINSLEQLETVETGSGRQKGIMVRSAAALMGRGLDLLDLVSCSVSLGLSRLRSRKRASIERHLIRAARMVAVDDIDNGRKELAECIHMDLSHDGSTLFEICSLLYEMNDLREVESLLDEYAKREPADKAFCLLRARTALRCGAHKDAYALLEKHVWGDDYEFWPDYLKGLCEIQTRSFAASLESFRRASERSVSSLAQIRLSQVFSR